MPARARVPAASEARRPVEVRAWCRADLAGGTFDIWPLGLLHAGARTVNLALDLAVTVRLEPRREGYSVRQADETVSEPSLEGLAAHPGTALVAAVLEHLGTPPAAIELSSDSPRGGGLGASSALAVALLAAGEAFAGGPASPPEALAAVARDLEARLMGLPTGLQDHFPALVGGALELRYEPGGERVRRLDVDLQRLAGSLLIAYSGESHFSAGTNWQVIKRRLDGDPATVEAFDGIAGAAADLAVALEAGDLEGVGRLMAREWSFRRRLAAEVSTPAVESLLAAAGEAGAWGGKACGAGGGGCVAVLAPPDRRRQVAERLTAAGGRVLPARPAAGPLQVVHL